LIEDVQISDLLDEVRKHSSYSVYQRTGMKLTATGGPALVVPGRRVKVAILSSFTVDPIKAYLQVDCLERGVWADVFIPSFNQFQQEILSPDSDLYKFTPDICFLHVQPDALLGGVSSGELSLDDVEPLVDAVRGLIPMRTLSCPTSRLRIGSQTP
jgi:hypothetical protein